MQDDCLATVLQVPLLLGHLWVKRQIEGTDIEQACSGPPQSTLVRGQPRGAQGTPGSQWPTAVPLSSFLVERCMRSAQDSGNLQRGAKPGTVVIAHSQEALGLGPGTKAHLSWGLSGPFPLSQSPREARCTGQVTFSRSGARMPGNKSYPRVGNQCRPGSQASGEQSSPRESNYTGGGSTPP